MQYTTLIIFYFSGTGNAKNAALWFEQVAMEKGLSTSVINIESYKDFEWQIDQGKTLIGFFTPTHGFNVPPIMLKFLFHFPKMRGTDAFVVNTRGGLKLYKLFLPGLSGVAQYLPAIILRLKGLKIAGMQPLDLPSNWLFLHPGIKDKVIQSMYSRCKLIMEKVAEKLISGKLVYKAFLSFPFDVIMAPVAVLYYFFGRFFLAKTLIATDACTHCDLCLKQCPVKAIKKVNDRLFWTYKCESCMRCANICPYRAIETAHGFSISIVILFYLLILPLITKWLVTTLNFNPETKNIYVGYLWFALETAILILLYFIGYRLLNILLRFKIVNQVVEYSSFSKYLFWRRYKGVRKK